MAPVRELADETSGREIVMVGSAVERSAQRPRARGGSSKKLAVKIASRQHKRSSPWSALMRLLCGGTSHANAVHLHK